MPDNRQNQSNAVSNGSNGPVDNLEEKMRRMKIENGDHNNSQEKSFAGNPPYPDRPGEPDCLYYLRTGLCGYGSNCRFNHPSNTAKSALNNGELPQRAGQPDCGFYLKTGTCKYGSTCKYHHPRERGVAGPAALNALGLPIRQDEKSCPYYMRTYTCKFGAACKFNHPQPPTMLPVTGPASTAKLGAIGSAGYPSMGMPYSGGLGTWLLPGTPYLPSPRVAGPPSYAPFVAPSQGSIMAMQGWNTYMGTVSPTSTYGTNFYNPKDQSGFAANGQVMDSSKFISLPERPDQPECRYFMSTGSCKYGPDCKYHHPRVAQLAMFGLGPHGLPVRPVEAVCPDFQMYGMCKFGPTCRFNHPVGGYFQSPPNFSLQPPPTPLQPLFNQQPVFPNYPRNNNSPATTVNNNSTNNSNNGATDNGGGPPSKSVKINDWIQKPDNVEEEHKEHLPDVKTPPEDSPKESSEVSSKD